MVTSLELRFEMTRDELKTVEANAGLKPQSVEALPVPGGLAEARFVETVAIIAVVTVATLAKMIVEQCEERAITTICIGKPHLSLMRVILATNVFNDLLKKMSESDIDLVILS